MNEHGRDERFRKSHRIRKRKDFLLVQQRGKRVNLRDLIAVFYPNCGGKKVGITVSRKVGRAVQRNRLKRLIREVWRRQRSIFPEGFDLIVIAKISARDIGYSDIKKQILLLCKKIYPEK